eukprot:3956895-Amphidinium_carterae.1
MTSSQQSSIAMFMLRFSTDAHVYHLLIVSSCFACIEVQFYGQPSMPVGRHLACDLGGAEESLTIKHTTSAHEGCEISECCANTIGTQLLKEQAEHLRTNLKAKCSVPEQKVPSCKASTWRSM